PSPQHQSNAASSAAPTGSAATKRRIPLLPLRSRPVPWSAWPNFILLELHAEVHAVVARHVGEIADACAAAALAIHRQERALVEQIVDEHRCLPFFGAHAP